MPTTLRRIQVTIDPELADALVGAEREWPGRPHAEQVARLAKAGADALATARAGRRATRRAVLEETRGMFGPDVFPQGYLEELRRDWPK